MLAMQKGVCRWDITAKSVIVIIGKWTGGIRSWLFIHLEEKETVVLVVGHN